MFKAHLLMAVWCLVGTFGVSYCKERDFACMLKGTSVWINHWDMFAPFYWMATVLFVIFNYY